METAVAPTTAVHWRFEMNETTIKTNAQLRTERPDSYELGVVHCMANRAVFGDGFDVADKIPFDLPRMRTEEQHAYNVGWNNGHDAPANMVRLCWQRLNATDKFRMFHTIWSREKGTLRFNNLSMNDAAAMIHKYRVESDMMNETVHLNDALSFFAKKNAVAKMKTAFGDDWRL